jgi:Ser/Thr protein kinase RdoA (MazF antagonist)
LSVKKVRRADTRLSPDPNGKRISKEMRRRSSITQEMAEQQALLTRLVEEVYGCHGAILQPISPYQFEDRGIYRVDWEGGTSSVLRAFLADITVELTGHAAVLDYLQQRGIAAPQVKHTCSGAVLAHFQGWTALFVSFLEGEVADFTLDSLHLLSACVGRLHTLSHNALAEAENARLPDSRLRPTQLASQAIGRLTQALPRVPDALRQFCEIKELEAENQKLQQQLKVALAKAYDQF